MFKLRVIDLALAVATLVAGQTSAAETYSLRSHRQANDLNLVQVTMRVGGTVKLAGKDKPRELPMSVDAKMAYEEKLTAVAAENTPARSFRYYREAVAAIKIDKGGQKPTLRDECRLIAAQTEGGVNTLFCPTAPLTREELDLISDIPCNSLVLDQLLPEKPVAVGATWQLSDDTLQALLGLEAINFTEVQSVLGEVKDNAAEVAFAGSVRGANGGIGTEMEVKARYVFDLKEHRIARLAILVKEKRADGHVNPGVDVVAKLTLKITRLASSTHLTKEALAKLPSVPTPKRTQLIYESPRGELRFVYDRRWDINSSDPTLAVMRLVDRGELVAQCNVAPLTPVTPGKQTSLSEFQADVQKTLGKNFGRFVNASQKAGPANVRILRVVASGEVAELPIQWIYYLIANEQGQQVSLAFTLEEKLAERFGDADGALVSNLRLLKAPEKTASKSRVK